MEEVIMTREELLEKDPALIEYLDDFYDDDKYIVVIRKENGKIEYYIGKTKEEAIDYPAVYEEEEIL